MRYFQGVLMPNDSDFPPIDSILICNIF